MTHAAPQPLSPEYARDRRWLDAHLSELVARHPDKWVAVLGEQVVAVGDSMEEVGGTVRQQHPNSEPVIWLLEGTIRVYADRARLS